MATLFYSTTDEDNKGWHNDESWLGYDDECAWYMSDASSTTLNITGASQCAGESNSTGRRHLDEGFEPGHYQHLWLVNNNLRFNIPPEISLLSNLKTIDLEMNSLSGSLPTDLSGLRQLEQVCTTMRIKLYLTSGIERSGGGRDSPHFRVFFLKKIALLTFSMHHVATT